MSGTTEAFARVKIDTLLKDERRTEPGPPAAVAARSPPW